MKNIVSGYQVFIHIVNEINCTILLCNLNDLEYSNYMKSF